ncbi:119.3 kDa Dynein-like beta chain [Spodoptera frugiperda ascovirus 1a]|uniref:Putative structural protein ORF84 n=1 Tax=Spodoptera frugiperda ascovirus 1a TaxID=113370 RepID=Y084_SFAVA|nr:119.3 kDa Dynein-like beta chain [Spodoptera frugiperda ascovirus 1a]Q0E517.1 RecName: Full=Putative structural protein ORF84 [Spodoptera frugiperda ascovirus 1a]CAL44684.1 119.3 kDa Dynein-like beta chain [Spodoptera frugiperda ascovirus 1a]
MIVADRLNTTTSMVWFPDYENGVGDNDAPRSGTHRAIDMYRYVRDLVSTTNQDGPRTLSEAVEPIRSWVDRDREVNLKFVEMCIIDAYTTDRRQVDDDIDAQTVVILDAILTQDGTGLDSNGAQYYRDVVRTFHDRHIEHAKAIAENKRLVPLYVAMYSNWSNTSAPTRATMDIEAIRGRYTVSVPESMERPMVILFNDLTISEDLVVFATHGELIKYDTRYPPSSDAALAAMSSRRARKGGERDKRISLYMVRRGIYSPGMNYDIAHVHQTPGVGYVITVISNNAPTVDVPRSLVTALGMGGDDDQVVVSDVGGGVTYTASFVLNDITFVTEYLQHYTLLKCTDKATCIFVDETHLMKYARDWRRYTIASPRFIYEYNNFTVKFSATVESTRRDVARVSPYCRIRIYDAPNTQIMYGMANDITAHMIEYKSRERSIASLYAENLHNDQLLRINVRIMRDSKRVKREPGYLARQHRQVRRKLQAQKTGTNADVRSLIGVNNYARQCARLPTAVFDVDDVPEAKEHITYQLPNDRGTLYVYCDHDDAPYPGVVTNRLAGNKTEYPTVPCCYRLRRNANGDPDEGRTQSFYNTQRILNTQAFGKCPANLESVLMCQRYMSRDEVDAAGMETYFPKQSVVGDATAVRGGVNAGPNAAIEAVMRAVHAIKGRDSDPRRLVITTDRLADERSEMVSLLTCASQELFDMSATERNAWLNDTVSYFDPLRLVKLLQFHFDVNVYVYVRGARVKPVKSVRTTENGGVMLRFFEEYEQAWTDNDDVLVVPHHYAGADYHDLKVHESSVVIYVHSGTEISNLTYPHVEYIIFKRHRLVVPMIGKIYQRLLPKSMRNVYSFVYFDVVEDEDERDSLTVDEANALRILFYLSSGKSVSTEWSGKVSTTLNAPTTQTIDGIGRMVGVGGRALESMYSTEPLPSLAVDNHDHSMYYFDDNVKRKRLMNPEHSAKCQYAWYLNKLARVLLHLTAYTILKKGTLMSDLFLVDDVRFNRLHDSINTLFETGVVDMDSYGNLLIAEEERVLAIPSTRHVAWCTMHR